MMREEWEARPRSGGAPSRDLVPADAIRAGLERILSSPAFANSPRLSRFLRFVVEHVLSGSQDLLKEYVLGVEVFERGEGFNPRTDSVVRVEAARLRLKLAEYYAAEGRYDTIRVEVPKGTYLPVFRHVEMTRQSPRQRGLAWALGGAATLAFVLAAGLIVLSLRGKPASFLAVLPFLNLSADANGALLAEGFVDDLTTRLAGNSGLRVVARTSAYQFRAKGEDIVALGRRLNVGSVLEGSIRQQEGRVHVTAQLIKVADGYHVWSETYDVDAAEVGGVQERIVRGVVRSLLPQGPPSPPAVWHPDPEARTLLWQGRYLRKQKDLKAWAESVGFFERALVKDPTCAEAYAALADVWATQGFHNVTPMEESVAKARKAANQALQLDDSLAEAHATLGWIRYFHDHDWAGSEAEFRRAIELNPSNAKAHQLYAQALVVRGRFDQAIAESRQAMALDPLSFIAGNELGLVLYYSRRYPEAIRELRRSLEVDPAFHGTHTLLGMCLAAQGHYEAAIAEYQKALAGPRYTYILGRLGYACERLGRRADSAKVLAEVEEDFRRDSPYYAHLALLYAGRNDRERTLEYLEKGCRRREADLNFIAVEPVFDSLRKEPGFTALRRELGLTR
jgi:serine/threonine-protein kinase